MCPPALFTYSMSPSSIAYSVSDSQLSIVSLTLQVTNGTANDVICPQISFTLPTSADPHAQTDLTTDPANIVAAPGPTTPWALSPGSDGVWYAMPLPPVSGLPAGSSISLIASQIVVNQAQGTVTVPIVETTMQGSPRAPVQGQASVTVTKSEPVRVGGDAPIIQSFTATPAQVALGGTTLLAWQTTGADSCVLQPGPITLTPPGSGSVPLPVAQDTTFTLTALGPGGTVQADATVAVLPVAITTFTAAPPGPVASGTPVTLTWGTRFASDCSIDQGVGPVAPTGSTVVTPSRTTIYTLMASGLQPQEQSVTVAVHGAG